jgi:hypothetical protein
MPIAEIIHEIDTYLSRLRQARELLSGRTAKVPQGKLPRLKKEPSVKRADPASSSPRRVGRNKTRSNRPVKHRKEQKSLGGPVSQVSDAISLQTANTKQLAKVEPERIIPQDVVITRLPASRRIRSFRPVGNRTAKQASPTSPRPALPAIALAGSTNARIVVVSADRVQRERAQAAQPELRRPRIVSSGLSGRRAFEALFADSADPSRGSSQ